MSPAASQLDDVHFRYPGAGAFEIRVPMMRIDAGERVACVGASGCGKTTLINLMSGVLRPTAGRVRLANVEIQGLSEAARRSERIGRIGMVFQEFELLDYLSVLDNILLPYRLTGTMRLDKDARRRARELCERLGIGHLLRRRPTRLSQGERQRAAVCRAIVTDPDLVIADEPTGNLDPRSANTVIDLLMDSVEHTGAALFVVTHNHGVLDRFDRVIRLDELNERGR